MMSQVLGIVARGVPPRSLGRFLAEFCDGPHLLIGVYAVVESLGRRLTAMFEEDHNAVQWALVPRNGGQG